MVTVEICIGSACYVKGSNLVVGALKELIEEENWKDKVEVKGSFCMQSCQNKNGLGIRVNGKQLSDVGLQNAKEILKKEISEVIE